MRSGWGMLSSSIPHPERIACCSVPGLQQPATKASHTIGGNNTRIVSSSWWWAYKCPKHVEHIISSINYSVAYSWFFFSAYSGSYLEAITEEYIMLPYKSLRNATSQVITACWWRFKPSGRLHSSWTAFSCRRRP